VTHQSGKDLIVECHSGHTYAERLKAFWWEGQRLEVDRSEAEWQSLEGKHFRVKTKNGAVYELIYDQASDDWQIKLV
jgi:hypothetical protein